MNCPKCTTEMVLAQATSFGEKYQYCRSCRKELKELQGETRQPLVGIDFADTQSGRFGFTEAQPRAWYLEALASGASGVCDSSKSLGPRERHIRSFFTSECRCGAIVWSPARLQYERQTAEPPPKSAQGATGLPWPRFLP